MGAQRAETDAFWRAIRAEHPRLWPALAADARVALRHRGESRELASVLDTALAIARLAWVSDAFLALALYRLKARLQAVGVPVVPRLAHRLAMILAQVSIGDPVVVEPGVYVLHGQLVIDGITRIGAGAVLGPFVTIGLRGGELHGPTLEREVSVGTGAKVIGPVRVGAGARIGAGAVVLEDVPAGATAVGVPARVVEVGAGQRGR